MNRQIGVGDSKYVIVYINPRFTYLLTYLLTFDPLLTGHVIRRMRSGRVPLFNGNQWETLALITQQRIGVRKRRQIAKILHSNSKSGSANQTAVSKFTPKVHK